MIEYAYLYWFFGLHYMDVVTKYQSVISYLFLQFPQYQQIGSGAYKNGLEGMMELDHLLGHPHKRFHSIHIAGTNGKGSVSHLLAAILQRAGYKVGLYTSPHLVDFRERIRINGVMIPQEEVVHFVERYRDSLDVHQPSFFEITTAMAFHHFAQQKVDIAVIETGLGGRLDSTNIIEPLLSVITNIAFDHCALLGDTLAQIATEKGGIIKPHVPVVIGERNQLTDTVFIQLARSAKARICFAQDHFTVEDSIRADERYQHFHVLEKGSTLRREYLLDLLGNYQRQNLPAVLMAAKMLRRSDKVLGGRVINEKMIKEGIRDAAHITGLRGRWECIGHRPKIIVDTAHNAHGLKWVFEQLQRERLGHSQGGHSVQLSDGCDDLSQSTSPRRLHIVFGMVAEKDLAPILHLLPRDAQYYFTQAKILRSLDVNLLMEQCKGVGISGEVIATVPAALAIAKENACEDDLIFVGGSTFVVAEALQEFPPYRSQGVPFVWFAPSPKADAPLIA